MVVVEGPNMVQWKESESLGSQFCFVTSEQRIWSSSLITKVPHPSLQKGS